MQNLTIRQTEDGGKAQYKIEAVSESGTELKAYLMTTSGEMEMELPLERGSAGGGMTELPDGSYVHTDISWYAKAVIEGGQLPEGKSTIVLILQRDGREIKRQVCNDIVTGKAPTPDPQAEEDDGDYQVGYICHVDDLSGMTFNTAKGGKIFVTGYVYYDKNLKLSNVGFEADNGSGSAGTKTVPVQKGFDRSDAAASRQALQSADFQIGDKNQGCFAIQIDPKKLSKPVTGAHEITVTFTFEDKEKNHYTATYTTQFRATDEPDDGETVKDAKTMLTLMGYQ